MLTKKFLTNSRTLFAIALAIVLVLCYCTKPKVHYLRDLPRSTFESRETFTCRINGRGFIPKAVDAASKGSCTYRKEYSGDEGHIFEITANQHELSCVFYSISITLDSVELRQGRSYTLGTPGKRKNYASYFFVERCGDDGRRIFTSDDLQAEVFITRIDTAKKLVVGSFDIKIRDSAGITYRMSDGFFDRHYE